MNLTQYIAVLVISMKVEMSKDMNKKQKWIMFIFILTQLVIIYWIAHK